MTDQQEEQQPDDADYAREALERADGLPINSHTEAMIALIDATIGIGYALLGIKQQLGGPIEFTADAIELNVEIPAAAADPLSPLRARMEAMRRALLDAKARGERPGAEGPRYLLVDGVPVEVGADIREGDKVELGDDGKLRRAE